MEYLCLWRRPAHPPEGWRPYTWEPRRHLLLDDGLLKEYQSWLLSEEDDEKEPDARFINDEPVERLAPGDEDFCESHPNMNLKAARKRLSEQLEPLQEADLDASDEEADKLWKKPRTAPGSGGLSDNESDVDGTEFFLENYDSEEGEDPHLPEMQDDHEFLQDTSWDVTDSVNTIDWALNDKEKAYPGARGRPMEEGPFPAPSAQQLPPGLYMYVPDPKQRTRASWRCVSTHPTCTPRTRARPRVHMDTPYLAHGLLPLPSSLLLALSQWYCLFALGTCTEYLRMTTRTMMRRRMRARSDEVGARLPTRARRRSLCRAGQVWLGCFWSRRRLSSSVPRAPRGRRCLPR
jgi:hypothetical protein